MPRVRVALPERFLYSTDIQVRIDDINYGGHLGNDAVLRLIHEARLRFFAHLGYTELNIHGCGILIADAAIEYRAQSFYGDILRIDLGLSDIGRKGCDLVYQLINRQNDTEVARIKTGIVFFDYESQRVVRIPQAFLALCGLAGDS